MSHVEQYGRLREVATIETVEEINNKEFSDGKLKMPENLEAISIWDDLVASILNHHNFLTTLWRPSSSWNSGFIRMKRTEVDMVTVFGLQAI